MNNKSKGFTLLEVLVVVAIVATLGLLAMPNFIEWTQKGSYKEAARDIAGAFSLAKSDAINSGTERKVVLDLEKNEFYIQVGNRARSSTTWQPTYHQSSLPSNSGLKAGNDANNNGNIADDPCGLATGTREVIFRPNSTVNDTNNLRFACVMDLAETVEEYRVNLTSLITGRVGIERR